MTFDCGGLVEKATATTLYVRSYGNVDRDICRRFVAYTIHHLIATMRVTVYISHSDPATTTTIQNRERRG